MRGKRLHKAAISLGFGIAFLTLLSVSVNRARPYPILDRNGAALRSLFDGVVATTPFKYVRPSPSCQAEKPDFFSRIRNILTPASVYAQVSCQVTGCYGHYFVNELFECAPACEGPLYAQAYSDPMGSYDFGYRQDGSNGCPLSACAFCKTPACSH